MQTGGDLVKWKTKWESSERLRRGSKKRSLKLRLKILIQKKAQSIRKLLGRIVVVTICYFQ